MIMKFRDLSGPYNGLEAKILFIKNCFRKSLTDTRVRRYAEETAGRGTREVQAKRLFLKIREVMVYTPDPVGVEMTKSPSRHLDEILGRGKSYGDCDDQACLAYTLLMSIGIPAKLRVVWYNKAMPQHIYVIANLNGKWQPFDTTRALGFGQEPQYTKAVDY